MISTKERIIRTHGTDVTIYDTVLSNYDTVALFGRASKQFNSLISLEAHRKGMFLKDDEVHGGYTVHNHKTNEHYLCVSMYNELIGGEVAAVFSHMVECNSELELSRNKPVADQYGNISKDMVTEVTNVKAFLEADTEALKQHKPGKRPENSYIIFSPSFEVHLMDRIRVKSDHVWFDLKVTHVNYLSYKGVVIMHVETETRL